jgi:hypothetical protein
VENNGEYAEGLRGGGQEPVGSGSEEMEEGGHHSEESPPEVPHDRRSRQALRGREEKAQNPGHSAYIDFFLKFFLSFSLNENFLSRILDSDSNLVT